MSNMKSVVTTPMNAHRPIAAGGVDTRLSIPP